MPASRRPARTMHQVTALPFGGRVRVMGSADMVCLFVEGAAAGRSLAPV
jgi:hypothetical protein